MTHLSARDLWNGNPWWFQMFYRACGAKQGRDALSLALAWRRGLAVRASQPPPPPESATDQRQQGRDQQQAHARQVGTRHKHQIPAVPGVVLTRLQGSR